MKIKVKYIFLGIALIIAFFLIGMTRSYAYSTYPGYLGGSMNYSSLVSNVGAPNSTNLGDLSYLETLFNFSKQYYSSFSSLGTFEQFSHIATTYIYRPSQNENRVHIYFSYSPIINRPGVLSNSLQNTFSVNGNAVLAVSIDNYAQTAKYWIYYDFGANEYISQTSSIQSIEGGTMYGYLSENNTYSNNLISDYYTMTYLDTFMYFYDFIYNPDLLVNNPNYHQVCVGYDDMFTILSNNGNVSDYALYNLPLYGLNKYLYQNINGVETMNLIQQYDNLIFKAPSDLSIYLSNSNNVNLLINSGYYNNIDDYFGWSLFHFDNNFIDSNNFQLITYKLSDVWSYKPDCIEIIVGDTTQCIYDTDIVFGNEVVINFEQQEYCFYIPTSYDLRILNTDMYGDIDDTLTINGTDYVLNSYWFETEYFNFSNNDDYKSSANGAWGFFKGFASPIFYINSKITQLFYALPDSVQGLIIAVVIITFIIAIIKFAMNKH